ncbi:substrate-binding domain-containing protein [Deinococcus aquiradiocola]|nr:substrate-binding domain-containing protein [Deinococcus aquiradiocola]
MTPTGTPDRAAHGPPADPLPSRVRARREELHVRPGDLAARCGITRQALHAIETDAYTPNTVVALRLARALACRVEDLFQLQDDPAPQVHARLLGPAQPAGTRVQLAQLGDDWLAQPLSGQSGWDQPADGTLRSDASGDAPASVQPFTDLRLAQRTAVLTGCDPSLGLAAMHAARHTPDVRVLWRNASSLQALRAVARGEAHAAGIHLWEATTGISNLGAVERELPGRRAHLYTLWEWEQGLIVPRGNPKRVTGPESLIHGQLRLVNREDGAGSRLLLDAWLAGLGVTLAERARLPGYRDEAPSHLEAAGRVAAGVADAAPGPRSAAQVLGLDFVPVQRERFDLVVPDPYLTHPAIAALIGVAQQQSFRAELSALGGYDPAHAGEHWQSTP